MNTIVREKEQRIDRILKFVIIQKKKNKNVLNVERFFFTQKTIFSDVIESGMIVKFDITIITVY